VNPDQQVTAYVPALEELIANQPEWRQARLVTILFDAFGLLALALAIVGLYSVVSYSIAQRTNEFGIRMALGAQRSDVLSTVLSSISISLGSGIFAGVVLTAGLNRMLSKWTEVGSRDPFVLVAVVLTLLAASMLAGWVPARRACNIDPLTALHYD
jgi:ABC-type antimicrobial peptide transport system permease subunit